MWFSKYRFLILSSLLAAFLVFAVGLAYQNKVSKQVSRASSLYHCPMHPSVILPKPGDCPICGMKLQRAEQAPKVLYYRNPMRPDVISPTPAKDEMGMDYIPVYGKDEERTKISVPAHAEVTISPERQQLIGITADTAKEMPLTFTLHAAGHVAYNPDISNALAEYADAYQAYWRAKRIGTDPAREWRDGLLELAELRLRLAGFDDEQMGLIKTLSSGKPFLINNGFLPKRLTLPANAVWVITDIYEPDAELILPGQHAVMTAPALPGLEFRGEVKSVDPVLNSMTRMVRVRIEVAHAEKLKPRMSLDVHIQVVLGEMLAIPVDSVFRTGQTALAFVLKEEGRIEPHEIVIGREADGYYEVISGLSQGEKVVAQGGFLIDSESRIQAALQSFKPVGEHQHG